MDVPDATQRQQSHTTHRSRLIGASPLSSDGASAGPLPLPLPPPRGMWPTAALRDAIDDASAARPSPQRPRSSASTPRRASSVSLGVEMEPLSASWRRASSSSSRYRRAPCRALAAAVSGGAATASLTRSARCSGCMEANVAPAASAPPRASRHAWKCRSTRTTTSAIRDASACDGGSAGAVAALPSSRIPARSASSEAASASSQSSSGSGGGSAATAGAGGAGGGASSRLASAHSASVSAAAARRSWTPPAAGAAVHSARHSGRAPAPSARSSRPSDSRPASDAGAGSAAACARTDSMTARRLVRCSGSSDGRRRSAASASSAAASGARRAVMVGVVWVAGGAAAAVRRQWCFPTTVSTALHPLIAS